MTILLIKIVLLVLFLVLPVTFLCSRVSKSTVGDQKKLVRIVSYLTSTRELGLKIFLNKLDSKFVNIRAQFAQQEAMKLQQMALGFMPVPGFGFPDTLNT